MSRERVNQLLTTDCYDDGADKPWQFLYGARRRPLSAAAQTERLAWARRLLRGDRDGAWMYANVVWVDFCSKVIPGSERRAMDQAAAGRNKRKRLMSPDAAARSDNLGGSDTAVKQASFGDVRVWYFVAMTRGVFGATCFTDTAAFPGETQRGAYLAIQRLPALLSRMLGRSAVKPKVVSLTGGRASTIRATASSPATTTRRCAALVLRHGLARTLWRAPASSQATWPTSCSMRRLSLG